MTIFEKTCIYKLKQDDSLRTIDFLIIKAKTYDIDESNALDIIRKYSSLHINKQNVIEPIKVADTLPKPDLMIHNDTPPQIIYSELLEKFCKTVELYKDILQNNNTYFYLLETAKKKGVVESDAINIINTIKENSCNDDSILNKHPKIDSFIEFIHLALADGFLSNNELSLLLTNAKNLSIPEQLALDTINNQISQMKIKPEVTQIDFSKEKGDSFEKFIVCKFQKQFYSIIEWRGDKYINGYYATTTKEPDIVIEILKTKQKIAVECKYRTNFYKKIDSGMGFKFKSEEQVKNYQNYANKNNIKLFYVIGIGGEATNPKYVYVIPSDIIKCEIIDLKKHQFNTECTDKIFYYNHEINKLSLYKKT